MNTQQRVRHPALDEEAARSALAVDRAEHRAALDARLTDDPGRLRRALAGADVATRAQLVQRLQHQGGNRAVQRLLAPARPVLQRCGPIPHDICPCNDDEPAQENTAAEGAAVLQRCGPIPHDICPCNDDEPAQENTAAEGAAVQRQSLDELFDPFSPAGGVPPQGDSGAAPPVPDGPTVPAGQAVPPTTAGDCPPGYTICDFINEHISVQGQYALNRLYGRGGEACHDAIQMLSAVRSGQIQGVFKADEGKPAMLAQRHGTGWWTLQDHPSSVPPGGQAFVFEGEEPPMVVFKKSVAEDREALATALHGAWNASTIGGTELEVSPPSMKTCEPAQKEETLECPPGTKPDPANPGNCLPEKSECPPGTVPHPSDPDICVLPNPGEVKAPCNDEEVFRAFQSAQDQCANIKMGIDMLCALGADGCDLIPNPIVKNLCKVLDPDQVKNKECKKPRAQYYADCTVGSVIGMRKTMKCDPGTNLEIFEKYKRWPGRIT